MDNVSVFNWFIALIPILLLLYLLLKSKWGVAQAAPVGLAFALVSGMTIFGGSWELLSTEVAKGLWNGILVMSVVAPAILIYEVAHEAKAFDPIRYGLRLFSKNELLQILALGWVFVSFLQGVTGFGVPVAVCAPLLVGIGVRPTWAVIIALTGHAWGNTFGTLAVAWSALVFQSGINDPELISQTAFWACVFTWIMDFAAGLAICWFYNGLQAVRSMAIPVLVITLLHGGGQMIFAQINPTLANFVVSSLTLVVIFFIGRIPAFNKSMVVEDSQVMDRTVMIDDQKDVSGMGLGQAVVPYVVLTVVTLVVLMIAPLKEMLSVWKIGFSFPGTETALGFVNPPVELYSPIVVFTHAGTFLLLSALVGYFVFKRNGHITAGGAKRITVNLIDKSAPSTVAVLLLIAMSKVMSGTGQVEVLAYGTALATGSMYGLLAPFVGMLGSFMTSSNMASNILFGKFQMSMAEILSLNPGIILGAQTGGSAMGNVLSPGNVLLGVTTTGILGAEGEILKKVIAVSLPLIFLSGLIVLFYTLIF